MAKKKKPQPVMMPGPAWYDPALKENLRSSRRSLSDLTSDIGEGGIQQGRLASQWGINQSEAGRQKGEVAQSYQRSLDDLLKDRGYTQEDYGTNLADLQRQFERLGSAQTQQARSAGLARGGAGAQAAAKRTANQAYARKPIDTSYNRAMGASQLAQTRLGQDKTASEAGIDRALAAQGTQYGYDVGDLGTQLGRAQRDQTFFERASQNAILHQAASAGWAPPKPKPPPKPRKKGGRK